MTADDRVLGAQARAAASATDKRPHEDVASLRARAGGYVVDMVIFSAIAMLVLVVAGFVFLWSTDFGQHDPSDGSFYALWAVLGICTPLIWSLLNVGLLVTRQQTGGQYVAALRVTRDDGAPISTRAALAWWFAGNPLLFSWPMALVAGVPLLIIVALTPNVLLLGLAIFLIIICAVLPVAALIAAVLDHRNRGLHDRIVGTTVVPA